MLLVVDRHLVGAPSSDASDEAFRERVRPRRLGGVLTRSMPSALSTASKDAVYFESRSRIRNRNAAVRSPRSRRFRACWVVHTAVGWAVTPRIWTRRLVISMTNSTYSRRRVIVSTWKKSVASSPDAWVRRNVRHVVSMPRGAGPICLRR